MSFLLCYSHSAGVTSLDNLTYSYNPFPQELPQHKLTGIITEEFKNFNEAIARYTHACAVYSSVTLSEIIGSGGHILLQFNTNGHILSETTHVRYALDKNYPIG